jgi:hypothetical protein
MMKRSPKKGDANGMSCHISKHDHTKFAGNSYCAGVNHRHRPQDWLEKNH